MPEPSLSRLESEGIECFVADEHIVRMIWIYSVFVGGVKLQVKESDAERAKGILAEVPKGAEWAQEQEASPAEPQIHCPSCGSGNVYFERIRRRLALAGWFFGLPLRFSKKRWSCWDGGDEWKEAKLGRAARSI
ncbi:MAG: DUF2007 domain-containing protein [Terriglobia bacterium]